MQNWDISLQNITVGYGSLIVLKNISVTFPSGSISVILGGSGCGKSTLLRHIIGLQKPLGGRILIGEHDLFAISHRDFRRIRRHMGVLFQDGALLGSLTLSENVVLPLSQHLNLPRKLLKETASRILEMVGLEDFMDYYPNQLSGGMRKRAGLARAIITEPPILLCDEPTSGLDPITAARMDDLLLSLHKRYKNMTIIVVSHDLASLKRIADYTVVLKDGEIIFKGTLNEIENNRDSYIEQFLQREPGEENINLQRPLNPIVVNAIEKWIES